MKKLRVLCLLGALLACSVAWAATGDEIDLADGRVLRLTGIKAVSPDAAAWLKNETGQKAVRVENQGQDRYGRLTATVFAPKKTTSVQEEMLRQGLAIVYPLKGNEPRLEEMLAAEAEARREKRGFWATHRDAPAAEAAPLQGHFGFVTGTAIKINHVRNRYEISLGEEGQPAFILIVPAGKTRAFAHDGVVLKSLPGKQLRLRGFVQSGDRPFIEATSARQIEILNP